MLGEMQLLGEIQLRLTCPTHSGVHFIAVARAGEAGSTSPGEPQGDSGHCRALPWGHLEGSIQHKGGQHASCVNWPLTKACGAF